MAQAVAELAADGQCLLAAADGFLRSPQLVAGEAEVIQRICLPEPVAELAEDSECLMAVSDGFFRAPYPVGVAEGAQDPCFPGPVVMSRAAARPSWHDVSMSCHGLRMTK